MKSQDLFCLKNQKIKMLSAAIVIGALRVKNWWISGMDPDQSLHLVASCVCTAAHA